jgi:hypothetical protein
MVLVALLPIYNTGVIIDPPFCSIIFGALLMGSSSIISLGLLIAHCAIHNSGNIIDGSLIYNIPWIMNGARHSNLLIFNIGAIIDTPL